MGHPSGCDREHSLRGNLDATMNSGRLPETDGSPEAPRGRRPNQQLWADATQSERVRILPTRPLQNGRPMKRGCEVDDLEDCSSKGYRRMTSLFSVFARRSEPPLLSIPTLGLVKVTIRLSDPSAPIVRDANMTDWR